MQELIDEMDVIKHELWNAGHRDKAVLISDMITKAVIGLKEEKEQIIKAVEDTRGNIVPKMFIDENLSGQEYYNQTYNQNT